MTDQKHVFKVGHCPLCSRQTQITDTFNKPIGAMAGTHLYWLCLKDDQGTIKTRIGTLILCDACHSNNPDPEKIYQSIINSPFSGLSEEQLPEIQMFPNLGLECVKSFGV